MSGRPRSIYRNTKTGKFCFLLTSVKQLNQGSKVYNKLTLSRRRVALPSLNFGDFQQLYLLTDFCHFFSGLCSIQSAVQQPSFPTPHMWSYSSSQQTAWGVEGEAASLLSVLPRDPQTCFKKFVFCSVTSVILSENRQYSFCCKKFKTIAMRGV